MEIRHFEGVAGKRDQYQIDPRTLKVRPDFNLRDLDSPKARERLDVLKAQIKAQGVIEALEIEFDGETPWINEGHRRHKVVLELIAEGEDIKTVPCIPERRGTKPEQRTLHMLMRKKEEYEPLEYAKGIERMVNVHGWDPANLAAELGFKSKVSIEQYLDMLTMPEAVKEQVTNNEVSATLALKVTKQNGAAAAPAILKQAKADVEASGAKRGRITPKAVARVTGKSPNAKDNGAFIDFVAIGNKVEDAARLAGGLDKLGPERTRALLQETIRTLHKAKGKKVDEAPDAADKTDQVIFEQRLEDARAFDAAAAARTDPSALAATPSPAASHIPLSDETPPAPSMAQVTEQIERIVTREPAPVSPPPRSFDINQNFFSIICRLATIGEGFDLNALADDHPIEIPAEVIKAADRSYREHIGEL
jgi:hypothetical protein